MICCKCLLKGLVLLSYPGFGTTDVLLAMPEWAWRSAVVGVNSIPLYFDFTCGVFPHCSHLSFYFPANAQCLQLAITGLVKHAGILI